ncbi:MAG: DNA polymerase III subunit delta [Candidatus Peribacteraceae bacterium]|jgi:DNA polymerase-3 subunit delta|nr:DNA polymerase III subunit delta [Candidatus Peribacteraceae bacterium]MDP7454845.1 DNA polymerase III subunit delta [Candidatus Peribacteraceae bacterium]MDP7646227.1 DNA polymerase III subunit delta [Candidatus Peribacteraceae bacterium]
MSQFFLFSGPNQFALREEKMRWIANFREKHGEENLLRFDAKKTTIRSILDEIAVAPFIAENRLVIVDGAIKCSKDEAKSLIAQIHPQVVLLFIVFIDSSKKSKFPAGMKEIEKISQHKIFGLLNRNQLLQWMDSVCKEFDSSITPEAKNLLIEISGDDQDMLTQELNKLSLYAYNKPITSQHVLDLAVTAGEREVWHLLDLLGSGKVEEGIMFAESLIARGDDPAGMWGIFVWSITRLTLIWTAVQDGIVHPAAVCREAGVPFPTARALLPCARSLSKESLTRIVDLVARMDKDLKTGILRGSADNSDEQKAVIDRCLMAFSNN